MMLPRLTGSRAWSLKARAMRSLTWNQMQSPDCMDVSDWRKKRAIETGTVIERHTV